MMAGSARSTSDASAAARAVSAAAACSSALLSAAISTDACSMPSALPSSKPCTAAFARAISRSSSAVGGNGAGSPPSRRNEGKMARLSADPALTDNLILSARPGDDDLARILQPARDRDHATLRFFHVLEPHGAEELDLLLHDRRRALRHVPEDLRDDVLGGRLQRQHEILL